MQSQSPEGEVDRQEWRLLPSERVLWHGRPVQGLTVGLPWIVVPAILLAIAAIFGSFAGLVWAAEIDGAGRLVSYAVLLAVFAVAVRVAPRYLHDPCEYLVTDRRIHWRRGPFRRSIERNAINYARIHWHRATPRVGHLELVRAVPFGPLARQQRLQFWNVRAPDAVYALIRGVEVGEHLGDSALPLIDRLDPGEEVVWGAHPEGWLLGWREVGTASVGVMVVAVGLRYANQVGGALLDLEHYGLAVNSWTWAFFFAALALTFLLLLSIGGGLVWYGIWRARALGQDSEYVLTADRLLIRRGLTELSIDRRGIVDVAEARAFRGLFHVFVVLDAPGSRALADSGALGTILPSRDAVAPVLYELRDVDRFRHALLEIPAETEPPLEDAA